MPGSKKGGGHPCLRTITAWECVHFKKNVVADSRSNVGFGVSNVGHILHFLPFEHFLLHPTLCRTIFVQNLFKNYLCKVFECIEGVSLVSSCQD